MPDPTDPTTNPLIRFLRGLFPWTRPPVDADPTHPKAAEDDTKPPDDLRAATTRVQLGVIRDAFGREGLGTYLGGEDNADDAYLFRPEHVLIRSRDLPAVDRFFDDHKDIYVGTGRVVDEPARDLALYRLPPRRADGRLDVHTTLDDLDAGLGEGVARPDHILYVTPKGYGQLCPATEPEIPKDMAPLPGLVSDAGAGKGVRVSVVDTGWYAAAETDTDTPWLGGVEGDLETVDPAAIHPYAGHGTFVAGVVRCLAPATEIEVEGVLTHGGAVYESEIARQLLEAMVDRDKPDLISISAGTHTRGNLALIGFEALAAYFEHSEGEEAVLIVAAAGNDGSDRPFWPAAFDWVVSVGALNRDGSVCDFSNVGPWVDVYAHGRDLVNAFPTGTYTCYEPAHVGEVRKFEGLAQWSGTSFATPVVTGAIAAHMSAAGLSARQSRDALLSGGVPLTDPRAGSIVAVGPPFA